MTDEILRRFERTFLGKMVIAEIDRPVGYVHKKGEKTLIYPINYGYVPDVIGGDGEELDVYIIDGTVAARRVEARVIAIIFRENDCEDKLVAAIDGLPRSVAEIRRTVDFQEKYYVSSIEVLDE